MISASLLSANFANLSRDINILNQSAIDWFHLDIMDGVFVPNLSYGFPVIEAITQHAKKPLDAHLMIVDPDRYLERFQILGVQTLSVHYEASPHLHRTVTHIQQLGMKAGVAINPHTPVDFLSDILGETDFVLIMSVNPGFGAQKFIPYSFKKVSLLKEMIYKRGLNCLIQVDGGINQENAKHLLDAGADILVAGNAIFSASNPIDAINALNSFVK